MGIIKNVFCSYYILNGYEEESAEEWVKNHSVYKKSSLNDANIIKKYLRCIPITGKYNKLLDNRLALRYELNDYKKYLLKFFFQRIDRNGKKTNIPLHDYDSNLDINKLDELLAFVKEKQTIIIMPSYDLFDDNIHIVTYDNVWFIDGLQRAESDVADFFSNIKDTYMVTSAFDVDINRHGIVPDITCKKITVIVSNCDGTSPKILCAYIDRNAKIYCNKDHLIVNENIEYIDEAGNVTDGSRIKNWREIEELLKKILLEIKEINFAGIDLIESSTGFKILEIRSEPSFYNGISKHFDLKYFIEKINFYKKESLTIKKKCFLFCKNIYSKFAYKRGYLGFMMKNWQLDLIADWQFQGTTIKEKLWSHKRGFLSFRIAQYGLTNENYKNFLSDREYRKIRPINNIFLYWIYDKVIMRYILSIKKEWLPKYYFHILNRCGKKIILPLPDYSKKYDWDKGHVINNILNLLKEEQCLALKPSEGSHGNGFAKLEFKNECYYINGKKKAEDEFIKSLLHINKPFHITEFIENHSELSRLYDGVTHTIRLMVINKHGNNPWIANAFLRIGTKKTGATDNIITGGICARVDVDTGRIFQPEIIENHIIYPCDKHPDTKEEIKGVIPKWDEVKKAVLEISMYLFQIEYMGFDVVVTENNIKILEINTHQDLHRYPHYDKKIHKYFCYKIKEHNSFLPKKKGK